jgi:hypothetical protein
MVSLGTSGGYKSLQTLVGLPGFEPGTSCTPSKRASQAAPQPELPSVAPVGSLVQKIAQYPVTRPLELI